MTNVNQTKSKNVTALSKKELILFRAFKQEEARLKAIRDIKKEKDQLVHLRARCIYLAKKHDKKLLPQIDSFKVKPADSLFSLKGKTYDLGKICTRLGVKDHLETLLGKPYRLPVKSKKVA